MYSLYSVMFLVSVRKLLFIFPVYLVIHYNNISYGVISGFNHPIIKWYFVWSHIGEPFNYPIIKWHFIWGHIRESFNHPIIKWHFIWGHIREPFNHSIIKWHFVWGHIREPFNHPIKERCIRLWLNGHDMFKPQSNATIYICVLKCIKDTHRFDLGHPPIRSISTPSLIWIHIYFFLCLLLYCLYMSYILCYNYFIKRGLRKSKVVITCDQSNSAFDDWIKYVLNKERKIVKTYWPIGQQPSVCA